MTSNAPAASVEDASEPRAARQGKTLLAVATYNERENLPRLVESLFSVLPASDVLVVDDNSPDGTGDWVAQQAAGEPRLRLLSRPQKQGVGSALVAAVEFAIAEGYARLITLDADFSHPPEVVPQLEAAAEATEVVVASRYCPGGGIEGWPWYRRVASRLINTAARWSWGLKPRDTSGSFRCVQVAALARVDWSLVRTSGYAALEEMLWHLQHSGASIREVPYVFRDRTVGRSKLGFIDAVRAFGAVVWLGLTRRRA